jgi:hypothetical protein
MTPEDLRREARNTLARKRVDVTKIDPDDVARQIIEANPLDTLLEQAKESYRITLDVTYDAWTAYDECKCASQKCAVKDALQRYYKCTYVAVLRYGQNQFELHYDRDDYDTGEPM